MAAFITPTMLIAAGGFMQGKGIEVSPAFLSNANSYGTTGLPSEFQQAITVANDAWVTAGSPPTGPEKEALDSITASSSTIPFLGAPAFNAINSAKAAAAAPFSQGITGFASVFGQANAFGATSFQFMGALDQATKASFSDFGTRFSNYTDMTTGGITASLPNPAGVGMSLSQLGYEADIEQIKSVGDAGTLARTLIDLGEGNVGDLAAKLEAAGLTPDDLDDPASTDIITRILTTITGDDVTRVLVVLDLTPYNPSIIRTVADILNLKLMLPPTSGVILPSTSQLTNAFQNIGGNFPDMNSLTGFLNSVEVPLSTRLSGLTSPVPPDIKALMMPLMGSGSGPFGNPTTLDIFGSASGHVHTAAIQQMSAASAQVSSSALGIALSNALTTGDSVAIETATNNLASSGNAQLQSQIDSGNTAINDMTAHLALEQSNISKSGINVSEIVIPDVSRMMSFGTSLHSMGVDKMKLGTSEMFENMASNDIYGDAIKLSLLEGRNAARLSQSGVTNPIFMDADKQARKLGLG